jgi:hypothetical protein
MTESRADESTVLFHEPGASWWWLLAGPVSATTMLLIQLSSGYGWQPLLPGVFLVLVAGFLAIQVKAARLHTSVELTPEYLRQGAETILVKEIVRIYPEADGAEVPAWQSSRALGELTGVPRGRTGIGVKLSNDRRAQAWARKHRQLRTALGAVVNERAT